MNIKKYSRGIGSVAIIVILAVVLLGGFGIYKLSSKYDLDDTDVSIETDSTTMAIPANEGDLSVDEMVVSNEGEMAFSGRVLAGNKDPYLDFNKADYEEALKSGKLIVLNFYANWCPICKAEQPEIFSAFNMLDTGNVIGFRVNYKDSDTDTFEESLARDFGVAYQHTKVFIKDGQRIGKYPDSWNKEKYISEINKALTN